MDAMGHVNNTVYFRYMEQTARLARERLDALTEHLQLDVHTRARGKVHAARRRRRNLHHRRPAPGPQEDDGVEDSGGRVACLREHGLS